MYSWSQIHNHYWTCFISIFNCKKYLAEGNTSVREGFCSTNSSIDRGYVWNITTGTQLRKLVHVPGKISHAYSAIICEELIYTAWAPTLFGQTPFTPPQSPSTVHTLVFQPCTFRHLWPNLCVILQNLSCTWVRLLKPYFLFID